MGRCFTWNWAYDSSGSSIMTFKEAITRKCEDYAKDPQVRFIGYNTRFGSRMYGTLDNVDANQCLEAPVAENLMVGLAMGMSLAGFKPVVCFERHDFMLLALDALVNHVDKLPYISGGQFKFPLVIRAIVGSSTPIDPGPMHRQNYTAALDLMMKYTPVICPRNLKEIATAWNLVNKTESGAVIIVEQKDLYGMEIS